jgi:hypothetical protein
MAEKPPEGSESLMEKPSVGTKVWARGVHGQFLGTVADTCGAGPSIVVVNSLGNRSLWLREEVCTAAELEKLEQDAARRAVVAADQRLVADMERDGLL